MVAALESALIEVSTLTIALLLFVFGVSLLVHLRRQGGLELSLALMVANPSRRIVFLWGLAASLAALFAIGLADGLEVLVGVATTTADEVRTLLFAVGGVGILLLMFNALRTPPPTLSEARNLEETAQRLGLAATPSGPAPTGLGEGSGSEPRPSKRPVK